MIVVADASPLSNLNLVGRLDLLEKLFSEELVPPAVAREVCAPGSPLPLDVSQETWIRVQAPTLAVIPETLDLDLGEREAIALALEVGANRILIDEKAGRDRACQLGLVVLGVLGVLVLAKRRGILALVRPVIDDLDR